MSLADDCEKVLLLLIDDALTFDEVCKATRLPAGKANEVICRLIQAGQVAPTHGRENGKRVVRYSIKRRA
jgi:hypothetical protein